jgi:hypothetical protein
MTLSKGCTNDAETAIRILIKLNIHSTQIHLNDRWDQLVQFVSEPGPITHVSLWICMR